MQYTIIPESRSCGGYTARCVEIRDTHCEGETPGEALAQIRDMIKVVRDARNEEIHKVISATGSIDPYDRRR